MGCVCHWWHWQRRCLVVCPGLQVLLRQLCGHKKLGGVCMCVLHQCFVVGMRLSAPGFGWPLSLQLYSRRGGVARKLLSPDTSCECVLCGCTQITHLVLPVSLTTPCCLTPRTVVCLACLHPGCHGHHPTGTTILEMHTKLAWGFQAHSTRSWCSCRLGKSLQG